MIEIIALAILAFEIIRLALVVRVYRIVTKKR